MNKKIYDLLNKLYAAMLMISFFAGGLPIIPFIIAIILGGDIGEAISLFIFDKYYPIVIIISSISILIGLICLYIKKEYGFASENLKKDK